MGGRAPGERTWAARRRKAYTKSNARRWCSGLLRMLHATTHRLPGALRGALAAAGVAVLCGALAAVPAAARPAPRPQRPARAPASLYPPGATRPVLVPRPSQFAHVSARRRPRAKRKPGLRGNPARALLAFAAMQRYYYIPGSGLYIGEPFSYLWPFSQALAATLSVANIRVFARAYRGELHARLVGLQSYLDTNNSGAHEGMYTSPLPRFD